MSVQSVPNLLVLLSGSGRTLVNICDEIAAGRLRASVALVVGSRACPGLERARERGIRTLLEPGEIPSSRLDQLVRDADASLVVLAGYLRRIHIPESLRWRIVNIHPALLPSFGGPGMYGDRVHAAVLNAGCKVSGCTVHLCDHEYDRGPILVQRACPVLEGDDPHTLGARVFQEECLAYPQALRLLLDGRVRVESSPAGAHVARILPG
jgi:folate-dependent phosphoribosylglycinamide formyltransferase PurN